VQHKSRIYDLCSEPTVANLAAPVYNIIITHKDQEITSAACVHLLFVCGGHACMINLLNILNESFFLPHAHAKLYERVPIISGTGAAIWSKSNLGLSGHHHPRNC
jgi:hypothetical protein